MQTTKYTSLHTPKLVYTAKYTLKRTPDCLELYTPSLLQIGLRLSPCEAPIDTGSTFSLTLPNILSRRPSYPLDGALPAWLAVCSKASSQETCKYTPNNTLKYTSNHTWWYTPSLLAPMFPWILPCGIFHPNTHDNMLLYILWHLQHRDLLSCRSEVLGGIRLEAYGWEYLVGSRWHAACGRWKRVYVSQYHNVGHYSSPNLIVSAATVR